MLSSVLSSQDSSAHATANWQQSWHPASNRTLHTRGQDTRTATRGSPRRSSLPGKQQLFTGIHWCYERVNENCTQLEVQRRFEPKTGSYLVNWPRHGRAPVKSGVSRGSAVPLPRAGGLTRTGVGVAPGELGGVPRAGAAPVRRRWVAAQARARLLPSSTRSRALAPGLPRPPVPVH